LRPAPQRLGSYGKIVRSRSQHMSGERQHPRVSAMDPIIVVQRTGAPAGRQGRSLPEQTLWRRRIAPRGRRAGRDGRSVRGWRSRSPRNRSSYQARHA